jgi:hypothetical protein
MRVSHANFFRQCKNVSSEHSVYVWLQIPNHKKRIPGRKVEKTLLSLTLSDPTLNLVRQYDFPLPFRCRKKSDTVFVAFVPPLTGPVRRFSSCSTDFSQQIAQAVLFLFLYVFSFKTVG